MQVEAIKTSDGPQTMSGKSVPSNNQISPVVRRKVKEAGGEYVKIDSSTYASKWNGQPASYSTWA